MGTFSFQQSLQQYHFNRYTAICHHAKYHKMYNKKTTTMYLLLFWLYALTTVIPRNIGHGLGKPIFHSKMLLCAYSTHDVKFGFLVYSTSATFLIPYILICVSYWSILIYVRKNQQRLSKYSAQQPSGFATDIRLQKSVSIILLFLTIMWMPQAIAMTL